MFNFDCKKAIKTGSSPEYIDYLYDVTDYMTELMGDIVAQALAKNNEALSKSVGQEVKEQVLKEMNYLMREQDELQEERFRQLDAAIRGGIKRSKFTEKKEKIRKRNSHTQ